MILAALLLLQDPDDLVRRLGDDDPAVRQAAAAALIELGEPARTALIRAAESPDVQMSNLAGMAIREIDRRRAIDELRDGLDPLIEVLYPSFEKHVLSEDPGLRRATLEGILGPGFMSDDPCSYVRTDVLRAIARLKPPAAANPLRRLAETRLGDTADYLSCLASIAPASPFRRRRRCWEAATTSSTRTC